MARNTQREELDRHEIEALVEKLAARLKENPENGEGWVMLAKSYRHFGRFREAAEAYANALSRLPPDATVLADYADVLAMAQGQRLQGEPEKLIARALELDPRHFKALALAGSVAYEKKDYATAAQYWERMLPLVPSDSEQARTIQANVDDARKLAGTPPAAGPTAAARKPAAAPAASHSGVSGVVRLAPEIAAKVAPTDTVFIYARAPEGPRMPLAIVRKQARDLPIQFTLDDTNAMAADMTLSKQQQVVITARVSKSSSATPQPGDLEGRAGPMRNDASGVTIVIDREIR
jgi:cytochrome c-type biogenesis protein CcmH